MNEFIIQPMSIFKDTLHNTVRNNNFNYFLRI